MRRPTDTSHARRNERVLCQFLSCFQEKDYKGMIECCHSEMMFSGKVVHGLQGEEAFSYFRMICLDPIRDLKVTVASHRVQQANEQSGSMQYQLSYVYPPTRRRVVVDVISHVVFAADGLISQIEENFRLFHWERQALGKVKGIKGLFVSSHGRHISESIREELRWYMVAQGPERKEGSVQVPIGPAEVEGVAALYVVEDRLREEAKRRRTLEVAATRIQTLIRRWLASRELQRRRQMYRRRTEVAQELYSTEVTYIATLHRTLEVFITPLRQAVEGGRPIVSTEQIRCLFSIMETIERTNSAFLCEVQEKIETWDPTQTIGDVFLRMTEYMKMYASYVSNYNQALTLLDNLRSKNSAFRGFLETTRERHGVEITSHLITPIQRIPRYQLLLEQLVKSTWREHKDYADLVKALGVVQRVATAVNEKKREAENFDKILAIQNSIQGSPKTLVIVEAHRRFVCEGIMEVQREKHWSPYHWFLFNDMLLVAKPRRRESGFFGTPRVGGTEYSFKFFVMLKSSCETPQRTTEVIMEDGEGHKFLLRFMDEGTRNSWMEDVAMTRKTLRTLLDARTATMESGGPTLVHELAMQRPP